MMTLWFVILVILSAFFASAETAYFTLHQAQVIAMHKKRAWNAGLIFKLKSKPQHLLITILIGNNIVNILTASLATAIVIKAFGNAGIGIATGITTIVLLIFGEIIPKSYAQAHNKGIARLYANIIYLFYLLFYPITLMLVQIDNLIEPRKEVSEITREEVKAMSKLGLKSGSVHLLEDKFIEKVFALHDVPVEQFMTPKHKILLFDAESEVGEIVDRVARTTYSRFLVYKGNENNITGYVFANQILDAVHIEKEDIELGKIIHPVKKITASTKLEKVLTSMIRNRESIYLIHRKGVRNNIIGIITLKDILERLVTHT